jgi:Raf kinase inhibitor-like YbhB/YbcL family protein
MMEHAKTKFQLLSGAFVHGGSIPALYTCKGKNVSPPLSWRNPPEGTKSFAIVAEDADTPVGTITHWVIYNIPPAKSELSGAVPRDTVLSDGTTQGLNGMRKRGYMGPCPPWGRHRYHFRIYALDTALECDPRMNKRKLSRMMEGHILAEADLMGHYSKKNPP